MFNRSFFSGLLLAGLLVQSPAKAEMDEGAYLAARQAATARDFQAAATYYTQSLLSDPDNPGLLDGALTAYVALGQMDQAVPVARGMIAAGLQSQIAHLALAADAADRDDWMAIFDALEAGREISPLIDGIAQGWAALGDGDMDQALASFDEVIEGEGMSRFGLYHKALALALVGDYESAEGVFAAGMQSGTAFNGRAAIAHAQVLSQLGRNDDALALMAATFGNTLAPAVVDLVSRLESGEVLDFDVVTSPAAGLGEAIYMVARLLVGETPDVYTLQYARIAAFLDPTNVEATLLSAELLEGMERYALASETYARVSRDNPAFLAAEMGRINVLQRDDRIEAAVEAATGLSRDYPQAAFVHTKLGDVLRMDAQLEEAVAAYTKALGSYGADDPNVWRVHYTRGIAAFYLDDWTAAESDFRAALALNPENPNVLNFLGYSLVERGEKLDEALAMIQRAVAGQPDNGAIVDSLGWALFVLGDFEGAVGHLERAASLEAVDPVVNDHLGDAYWAVGRRIEAAFQWNRALSFDPEEEVATRIRRKLEVGLDVVRAEEGGAPFDVAHDKR